MFFGYLKQSLLAVFLFLSLSPVVSVASDYSVNKIIVADPYSRALPPISENGAVYFIITNHGENTDQLIGATTPIARNAEIHTHTMEDGMARMRMVDTVNLPPHAEVIFEPSGHHIMLIGLVKPLKAGANFPLILNFRDAEHLSVVVNIRALDGAPVRQKDTDSNAPIAVSSQANDSSNTELSVTATCVPMNERLIYRCRIELSHESAGNPVDGSEFTVSVDMPSMRGAHSQSPVLAKYDGMGAYYVDLKFEMRGEWELKLEFLDSRYTQQLLQLSIAS